MLRDWGAEKKYQHVLKGYNYRMEGIQGAVLRVKLKYLEGWTEARRAAAAHYARFFAGSNVQTPEALAHNRHVYHIYAIRTPARAEWMDALQKQGIASGIHYPIPVHLLPAYADLGYKAGQFPHSERAAHETMSLPMFPELTAQQCQTVAQRGEGARGREAASLPDQAARSKTWRRARPLLIFPCNGNGLEALDCLGDGVRVASASSTTRRKSSARAPSGIACLPRSALRRDAGGRGARGARRPGLVPGAARGHRRTGSRTPSASRTSFIPARTIAGIARLGHNVLVMAGVVITSNAHDRRSRLRAAEHGHSPRCDGRQLVADRRQCRRSRAA